MAFLKQLGGKPTSISMLWAAKHRSAEDDEREGRDLKIASESKPRMSFSPYWGLSIAFARTLAKSFSTNCPQTRPQFAWCNLRRPLSRPNRR
jgi:hypothetical protein